MLYLLALIGVVTVLVLLWKAFGPVTKAPVNGRVTGPDDDPEFLWRVNRDVHRKHTDGDTPTDSES
ncbi:hypothetical protein G4H71_15720 [Rhodococcus triatomae]|uniref:Uncharacterized protein n=1 Tax=Rhodococcus triatomae TaxID=300028 RepID=A0A1G8J7Y1_9NOCA|nr:hypothetical protein [Rhodococcus triatomae]QNG19794.1 hypothetical protein G4H72_14650 [Rhodococcus triatomae]QNG24290.1 hypothetical protein G4H71_15720 [Rhodococcus triatomae]SDI27087.1 hypothetical protein SAMN05444695_10693 [Rhodococcus triatomae]